MLYSKTLNDRWSSGQKLLLVLGVVLALAAFFVGLWMRTLEPENGLWWMPDFHAYYAGGYAVLHGSPLYDVKTGPFNIQFNYQPFAAMLFIPFALMKLRIAEIVWTVLNVLALGAVSWIALDMMHISTGRRRLVLAAIISTSCTLLGSVLSNLIFGQICVFLMLLVLIDIQPWMPRWLCGIATGIAAVIKLTPLMFIVYLFFIGRKRGAIQAIAVFVAAFLIGLLVLPYDSKQYWFAGGFIKLSRIVTATDVQHSLSGFIARLTGDAMMPPLWTWLVCAVFAIYGFVSAVITSRRGIIH